MRAAGRLNVTIVMCGPCWRAREQQQGDEVSHFVLQCFASIRSCLALRARFFAGARLARIACARLRLMAAARVILCSVQSIPLARRPALIERQLTSQMRYLHVRSAVVDLLTSRWEHVH